ncbi:MAG TPA: polynucleotide kinase-phosphatase [Actinomycetota bacterium]|nr:polynucleotide kinase-phosphatase [Actinomycetota bacterium]
MKVSIPNLSLVVLIGASGSGKSTFAATHFAPTEVISSDFCRGLVSDDENNQAATGDAFEVLNFIAGKRLAAGRLTVIDATSVRPEDRRPLVALARQFHCLPVAVVFNLHPSVCLARNEHRPDRSFGPHVVRNQTQSLRRSINNLRKEGFRHIVELHTPEEIDSVVLERTPLYNDRRDDHGPFDIIGDVHGCGDELEALLASLGYRAQRAGGAWVHPEGRKAVFVGDLVDRGPRVLDVLALVQAMVEAGSALAVPGNHDVKLVRKLRGRNVQITHGLAETLAELEALPAEERAAIEARIAAFLDSLVSHYVFDGGNLVVAHAGLKQEMQGRGSSAVRDFALYGETTGETDEFGLPVRYLWADAYRGPARVVYGHTPVPEAEWLNGTINVDTGCVFGGKLTALRYPELELVSVPAVRAYAVPARPFLPSPAGGAADGTGLAAPLTAQQRHDELLDLDDVLGKRVVGTRLRGNLTVREENAIAALEVMSRFAADPRWLIYLPPTMSPAETSAREGLLEHPAEAFAYFRTEGVPAVVCQEKHMGSRAIVIACRNAEVARRRFGVPAGESGIVYTRTGRRFFDDPAVGEAVLDRVRAGLDAAGIWDRLVTDWACLDCELMPWSAKAQELLIRQYAAVGRAGLVDSAASVEALRLAGERGVEVGRLLEREVTGLAGAERFVAAYRRYCWKVARVDDLKLAPFHLMATEGAVHTDKDHAWHMALLAELAAAAPGVLIATEHRVVDLTDPAAEAGATAWWEALTAAGGEGMVVKPLEFVARGQRGLVQPAVKCRGPEYLRIIYGPDYDRPEQLERLRGRGLWAKRSLALREFALGVEGLERFVRQEPLRRVHECAFAVLAMESEPVDPRL